ncbi:MAG: GNAT family N-acetyltransferase [Oscillospiraceae bacterium]|nr:GNAT family N-acetyltransferase [Oscillospiraceae bacterium]
MLKLQGERIYLAALEREHCRKLYEDEEYDFGHVADPLYIGASLESSDEWYSDIQKRNGDNVRLGIFLNDGTVIGDVALQDISWRARKCSLGMSIAKIENRNQGYGKEAARLLLDYAFGNMGLHRVTAGTLATNISGQKCLEDLGFVLEGTMRRNNWVAGEWVDKLLYAILREE